MFPAPRYRIVSDAFAGFEVQKRVWWWPFWFQGRINTHRSVEAARDYAERWKFGSVIEYLNI